MFSKPYLPAFLWLVVITALSVSSGVAMPKFNLLSTDKIGHTAAYFLFTYLLIRGFNASKKRPATWKECLMFFCLASAYGAFMEFIQGTYFPNRFFEFDDMLANAFGALMAVLVYRLLI